MLCKSGYRVILISIMMLVVTGCGDPDPVIHAAYAIAPGATTTNHLGDDVRPDEFVVHAFVTSKVAMNPGDTFLASLNIGTLGSESKYGGIAGLKFKVTPYVATLVAPAVVVLPRNRHQYRAVSQPPNEKILCDAQNRLFFRMPGDSRDDLVFRLKTPAMSGQLIARIGNHVIGLPSPPWPSTGPHQADGNYIRAPAVKTFHCLLEGSGVPLE